MYKVLDAHVATELTPNLGNRELSAAMRTERQESVRKSSCHCTLCSNDRMPAWGTAWIPEVVSVSFSCLSAQVVSDFVWCRSATLEYKVFISGVTGPCHEADDLFPGLSGETWGPNCRPKLLEIFVAKGAILIRSCGPRFRAQKTGRLRLFTKQTQPTFWARNRAHRSQPFF